MEFQIKKTKGAKTANERLVLHLDKPFLPLGGLIPFAANSSACLRAASSSANAARLDYAKVNMIIVNQNTNCTQKQE